MSKNLHFALNSGGPSMTILAPEGYRTKIRGMFFSLGPFSAVTGLASLQLSGLAADTSSGGSAGSFAVTFLPSTTEALNIPVSFGDEGVLAGASGPNYAINVIVIPNGSDQADNVQINVWGEFVPE